MQKISDKRSKVSAFAAKHNPKNKMLLNISIFCGAGAALMTMAATITTSLRSNHDTGNKLAKAQVCEAKLEMLELLLINNQIDTKQGIEKYGEYSTEIAFID